MGVRIKIELPIKIRPITFTLLTYLKYPFFAYKTVKAGNESEEKAVAKIRIVKSVDVFDVRF